MIDLLTRLRDAATPDRVGILPPRKLYTEAADEIERLSAQVERMTKALTPFAEAAKHYADIPGVSKTHPEVELWQQPSRIQSSKLTVGDLRRAQLLTRHEQASK